MSSLGNPVRFSHHLGAPFLRRCPIATRMPSMTWVFLTWCLTALATVNVAAQADGLFSGAESTLARRNSEWWADAPTDSRPRTLQSRLVRIDLSRLNAVATRDTGTPATLTLNLFDDTVFLARVERSTPSRSGYVLTGRLDDVPFGTMALAVNGSVVAGTVRTPAATWRIRSVGAGLHLIRQVDLSTLPPEAEPDVRRVPRRLPGPVDLPPVDLPPDDGSVIDMMIFYTPEAKAAEGGAAEIEALIDLMVAETNRAYADSGVIQRLNLVRREEVASTEEGSLVDDFRRFADPADGHMDGVYALRDAYAADLMHLVTRRGEDDPCGFANASVGPGNLQDSSSVTSHDCGAITFAHETGHNMGLRHDRYVEADSNVPYPYSAGYVNQRAFHAGAPESSRWRTVMAYPDQCNHAGFSCTRLFRFSNPDQAYNGDPMGVPGDEPSNALDGPANARRSLNDTRFMVANFRNSSDRTTCKPVLAPQEQFVPADGGTFEVAVTIHHECAWTATTNADFISLTDGVSGVGSRVVTYEVVANNGTGGRTGVLTISGHPFSIDQVGSVSEGICNRTAQVQVAITNAASVEHCWEVESTHLSAIESLYLSDEGIVALRVGDLSGLSGLGTLYLNGNDLSTLRVGIFAGLSSLRALYLFDNKLTALPEEVFAGLSRLEHLHLDDNALVALPAGIFANLTSLKYLHLSYNELASLPEGIFAGLSGLDTLWMESNALVALPEEIFAGLSSLKSLIIQSNNLTALPEGIFAGLSGLELLWMGGNALSALPEEIFGGLSNLENLSLGVNPLPSLPEGIFAGLSSLRALYLNDNKLTALPEEVFAGLSSLTDLWLFSNELTTLPAGIFSGLPGFTNLELDRNPGAPFTLTLQLVRTESTAMGGSVAVEVVEGAPFDMVLGLSATGGTLSVDTATIGAGLTVGGNVTVTGNGATITVRPGEAPPIPREEGCGGSRCILGLQLAVGGPVTF